jgi:YT521-B-like domain
MQGEYPIGPKVHCRWNQVLTPVRMAGPVRQGEHRVSWATRTTDSPASSRSSLLPVSGRGVVASPLNPDLSHSQAQGSAFFSPGSTRVVQESPLPLTNLEPHKYDASYGPPNALAREQPQSAPGEIGPPRSRVAPQGMKHSLDQQLLRYAPSSPLVSPSGNDFELDPTAPIRAMRSPTSLRSSDVQEWSGGSKRSSLLQAVVEEEEKGDDEVPSGEKEGAGEEQEEVWGESFKIEWLSTEKLPFHRTRHLRNPWNHDREVKVSRDGTELEPVVGRRLLEEWTRLSEGQPAGVPVKTAGFSKRGAKGSPSTGMDREMGAYTGDTGGRGAERPS